MSAHQLVIQQNRELRISSDGGKEPDYFWKCNCGQNCGYLDGHGLSSWEAAEKEALLHKCNVPLCSATRTVPAGFGLKEIRIRKCERAAAKDSEFCQRHIDYPIRET